jgi:hypothetical protein
LQVYLRLLVVAMSVLLSKIKDRQIGSMSLGSSSDFFSVEVQFAIFTQIY